MTSNEFRSALLCESGPVERALRPCLVSTHPSSVSACSRLFTTAATQESLAAELRISAATIYRWRQERIDAGDIPGVDSTLTAELTDARRRIRELEEELSATRLAASILKDERIRPKGGSRSSRP